METTGQACDRLVTALEDLLAQEAAALAQGDFGAALELQERAAPLVDYLAAHGPRAAAPALRSRIGALCERRSAAGDRLAAAIARVREELGDTQTAQRRVARIAPAYGRSSAAARQLSAVG